MPRELGKGMLTPNSLGNRLVAVKKLQKKAAEEVKAAAKAEREAAAKAEATEGPEKEAAKEAQRAAAEERTAAEEGSTKATLVPSSTAFAAWRKEYEARVFAAPAASSSKVPAKRKAVVVTPTEAAVPKRQQGGVQLSADELANYGEHGSLTTPAAAGSSSRAGASGAGASGAQPVSMLDEGLSDEGEGVATDPVDLTETSTSGPVSP